MISLHACDPKVGLSDVQDAIGALVGTAVSRTRCMHMQLSLSLQAALLLCWKMTCFVAHRSDSLQLEQMTACHNDDMKSALRPSCS